MDDHPSDHGQHPNRAPAKDLAALRRQRPDWRIRHASDDHPGELGYLATRGRVLLTAENLTRLGDRIADADRSWPAAPPPAFLITGPPGWNSGPCLDPGGPLGQYMGRWAIDVQPAQVPVWCAVRQRGSETRVVIAFSAPELADKLTAIEDADGAAPDVGTAGRVTSDGREAGRDPAAGDRAGVARTRGPVLTARRVAATWPR